VTAVPSRTTGAVLVDELIGHRWDYFSGVPCSLLKGAFSRLESLGADEPAHYLPAPREEVAVAAAAGAYLAGRNPVVFMQNSGLGYCLNTLTSLLLIYRIPLVLVISWRGWGRDAVEHVIIGEAIQHLLDDVGVPHQVLGDVPAAVHWSTTTATADRKPVALLVKEEI
jgi:phosphonopyruvate decarboxylase